MTIDLQQGCFITYEAEDGQVCLGQILELHETICKVMTINTGVNIIDYSQIIDTI